jgi:hypothetical protein
MSSTSGWSVDVKPNPPSKKTPKGFQNKLGDFKDPGPPYYLYFRRGRLYVRWTKIRINWGSILGTFDTLEDLYRFQEKNYPHLTRDDLYAIQPRKQYVRAKHKSLTSYENNFALFVEGKKGRQHPRFGKKRTAAGKMNSYKALKGSKWVIDDQGVQRRLRNGEPLPEGWRYGRYRWKLSRSKLKWEHETRRKRLGIPATETPPEDS